MWFFTLILIFCKQTLTQIFGYVSLLVYYVSQMADVARGHRGDCFGGGPGINDPPGGGGWQPPNQCQGNDSGSGSGSGSGMTNCYNISYS